MSTMRLSLALAWRNIWRKPGRSLVTMGAVALIVVFTLVYFGIGGAARNALYASLTESTGHLQIRVADYRESREFTDLLIRDAEGARDALAMVAEDAWIVGVLHVTGLLEGNGRSRGVVIEGVERHDEHRERYAAENLHSGTLPGPDDPQGIALSASLARAIRVGLGDTVHAYAPGTEGTGIAAYTVVGILDLPAAGAVAQLSLAAAQDLAAPGAVTRFEIHRPDFRRASDDDALPAMRERAEARLGERLAVETWRDANPGMAAYVDLLEPMQAVATAIFFVLAGLLVTNTVYLSVIERVREFGIIQALGASRRTVLGMVLVESLVLCFLGALAGALVAGAVVTRMAQGFSFPAELGEYLASLGLPTVLYASVSPLQVTVAIVFTFAIGVLAAVLPAVTATRLVPIDAIRHTA